MSDWDEIRKLAADFQKVQSSAVTERLSERNCVELVSLLIEKGLIRVVFTTDGKEYLTPEHLRKEIEDELYVNGGRINLAEIAKFLNVNLNHIEDIAKDIVQDNPQITLVLGQLIDEIYLERVATEVNERLAQMGELSVSDVTVQFDLPADFLLQNIMVKYIGTIIKGKQDSTDARVFFTQNYVSRCKAKVRGALAALTRPTPVATIVQQISVPERMFYMIFNEIKPAGHLTSKQAGALYIPNIHTDTQVDWVKQFYARNNYLEYDMVGKLGISDPKGYIKRQFPDEELLYLDTVCVGNRIREQLNGALEECIASGNYLDVSQVLPAVFSTEDVEELLSGAITRDKKKNVLLFSSIVLTTQYLETLSKPCEEVARNNGKECVDTGRYVQYIAEKQLMTMERKLADLDEDAKGDKKDERRKKATGGKVGGGTQGRETKTKSTKKHNRRGDKGKNNDSDDDREEEQSKKKSANVSLNLITLNEIKKTIKPILEEEGLEDLTDELAEYFYPTLSKLAMSTAQALYEINMQNRNENRRQTRSALQEKFNNFVTDLRLYEKGIKVLPTDAQSQLVKYLLKSVGTDLCNSIFLYVVEECNLNMNQQNLLPEHRIKVIQDCENEFKNPLKAINQALNATDVNDFINAAEQTLQAVGFVVKKIDKKKDRTTILCHKHALIEQLNSCKDPALVLHLATLIIFIVSSGSMIHASGRHVSMLLSFLKPSLSDEQNSALLKFHDLVIQLLNAGATSEIENTESAEILEKMNDQMDQIKEIAVNYKKAGVTLAD